MVASDNGGRMDFHRGTPWEGGTTDGIWSSKRDRDGDDGTELDCSRLGDAVRRASPRSGAGMSARPSD